MGGTKRSLQAELTRICFGRCRPRHGVIESAIVFLRSHAVITLAVNGTSQQHDTPLTLAQLLVNMDLSRKRVAVERNGEIVPRSQYAEVDLQNGDQLEIVAAVGGG